MKVKSRISSFELFFVLVHTMVGVGLLSLPYRTNIAAGNDGWISVLITGIMIQLIVLIIWFLCRKFPNLTLYDFSQVILGKTPGSVVNLLYILYTLIVVSYVFVIFLETLKRWILPETPAWILFLMGGFLLIYGGTSTIKQMVALFSFLFLFILLLCFIKVLVFHDSPKDIRYLLPIGSNGAWTILKSTSSTFVSFLGFETLLIYYAFMKQPKKLSAMKGAFLAVLFVILVYLFIVISSTILLSPDEINHTPEPVLYILSASGMTLISRFDLIFLAIMSLIVVTTIISYTFSASIGISKLIHVKHKTSVILFGVFVLAVSAAFYYLELAIPGQWINLLIIIFGLIIPIILLFITIIFKREESSIHEKN